MDLRIRPNHWNSYTAKTTSWYMGLLPDTQNCGLRTHQECRERFPATNVPRNRGILITTCATSGLLWSRWRAKCSRQCLCMHKPQFNVSGKRPMSILLSCLLFYGYCSTHDVRRSTVRNVFNLYYFLMRALIKWYVLKQFIEWFKPRLRGVIFVPFIVK